MLICIVLAAGFRLPGLRHGLPFLYNPDETKDFAVAQRMLKQLDPNPHFFNYPSLFLYFNSAVEACYFAVLRAFGLLHSLKDLPEVDVPVMGIGWTALPSALLTLRSVSLLLGVATVLVVYRMGRHVSEDPKTALLAAFFVAVSPSVLENTRWVTPEGLLTLLVTLALFASLRVWRFGRAKDYVLASVLAGLAASTKYNGALVGISVCVAAIFRERERAFRNPWLYAAPLIAVGSFLLTTPYALLDREHFLKGLMFERAHYATGHAGAEGNTFAFYCSYLFDGEGLLALLVVAGAILGIKLRRAPVLIIAIYCAAYFGFINTFVVRNGRTLTPIIPALLVLAAWFVSELFAWLDAMSLQRRLPGTLRATIPLALLAVLAARPLRRSFQDTQALLWKDNRELAHDWIEENIEPRARLALGEYSCYVDRHRYALRHIGDVGKLSRRWLEQHADYVVLSSAEFGQFISDPTRYPKVTKGYRMLFTELQLIADFNDPKGGSEIRVYRTRAEPPLRAREL